jgi:hypothetical protein
VPYVSVLLNEIIHFSGDEEQCQMNLFNFQLDWPAQQKKLDGSIAAFVSELQKLEQVKLTVDQAALDARLSNTLNPRNRMNIADLVHGEMKSDANRSPQDIFDAVKSRLQSATEEQDKVFDAVGEIIENAASFVGKVAEADVGGAASDAYGIANGLRKALQNDAKLGVEVADVLRIWYTAKVEATAWMALSAFNATTEIVMREAFAYRGHHKDIRLEVDATNSAARHALRAHNDPVETAAEKATNGLYSHFAAGGNPMLSMVQMATHRVTQVERCAANPFQLMQKAGWLANGHQSSTSPKEIVAGLVEDAVQKGPDTVKRQLNRDAAMLRAAVMELQIPQKHAQMVSRRYGPQETHAPNVTVLFEDQRFRSSVKDILAANPNAVRSPPPTTPQSLVMITHLQEELDLAKDMIVREGLMNPKLQKACGQDITTIKEIEKMLRDAPEPVQHIGVSWGRAPDRQFFGRLKDEVKETLDVALTLHAERQEERKTALQASMRTKMRGETPEVTSTRRLDRES